MSKSRKSSKQPVEIQVNAMELLMHDGIEHVTSHLTKGQNSFSEMIPVPDVKTPEAEFAMINVLATAIAMLRKVDPKRPEGVVLEAMSKNFLRPEMLETLASGGQVTPADPKQMHTPQFKEAMKALYEQCKDDPARRDALACLDAAHNRPLTMNEVYLVFRHLSDGMDLTADQSQQIVQMMVQDVQLKNGENMKKKLMNQGKPSLLDLATMANEGVDVAPDGKLTPRPAQAQHQVQPEVKNPDEALALLEISRDFWVAFFRAGADPKMQGEGQRELAQLLRNAGAMYVRTGRRMSAMQTVEVVDANAHRFLIRKLRASPLMRADRVRMMAVEKLAMAEETGQAPAPEELVEIFKALEGGINMTPEMTKAALGEMAKDMSKRPEEIAALENLMAHGKVDPAEVIRVVNEATMQKPEETMACLNLFVNMFIAMHATNQNAALRDRYQRTVSETLRMAGQCHVKGSQDQGGSTSPSSSQKEPNFDLNAYRLLLLKLQSDPRIKEDNAKANAVEVLVAAQATGQNPSPYRLQQIFQELGRGVTMTPEMLRIVLEYMCNNMKAMTPNEKIELQKRFRKTSSSSPTDVVVETDKVRTEAKQLAEQAQTVGCFQIFPQGHPALGTGRATMPTTRTREVGARAGPASIEWHNYKALGVGAPATEMARVVLVQSQLEDVKKFEDLEMQKTLMKEAPEMTFRSVLQPTVISKYQQTLKNDKAAVSALEGLTKASSMDEKQLGKKVDQLLETLTINRGELRGVLQQMVRDRLMTCDESRDVERGCVQKMIAGGGKMKLSDLQELMRARKSGR